LSVNRAEQIRQQNQRNQPPPTWVSHAETGDSTMTIQIHDIKEHMEVLGSDGKHVGTVDCTKGEDTIVLTKSDPQSGGQHHIISVRLAQRLEEDKVRLNKPARQVMLEWQAAA
jgi:hypothetical protein